MSGDTDGGSVGGWGATLHKGSHCFEFPQRERSSRWVGEEVLDFKPCWSEAGGVGCGVEKGMERRLGEQERGRRNGGEKNEKWRERRRVANCTFFPK